MSSGIIVVTLYHLCTHLVHFININFVFRIMSVINFACVLYRQITRMPLSVAERQRRFREKQKLDSQTLELYKQKKHDYYMKARKPIGSLSTDREKRLRRRGWKKAQKDKRGRAKKIKTMSQLNTGSGTPVSSSSSQSDDEPTSAKSSVGAIRQRYLRQINHLNIMNTSLTQKLKKTQKQNSRLRTTTNGTSTTPRSKSKDLMSGNPAQVRKTLIFHHALVAELQDSSSRLQSCQEKQILSKVLSGQNLKKYKLLSVAKSAFGLRSRQIMRNKEVGAALRYVPRKYARFRVDNVSMVVEQFFMEDINSRASAGKMRRLPRTKTASRSVT